MFLYTFMAQHKNIIGGIMKTKLICPCTLILMLTLFSSPGYSQWVKVSNLQVSCFTVSGPNIFAGSELGGVFLSPDNGESWNQVITGMTYTNVRGLASNGDNLFAGTSDGGVYYSNNNGISWTAVNAGLGYTDVRVLIANEHYVFAGTDGGGLFRSEFPDVNWSQGNNGLDNLYVQSFVFSGTNILCGTRGGGVYSSNNGIDWTALYGNIGLIYNSVWALAEVEGTIIAGTHGGGIFITTGTGWTGTDLTDNVEALAVDSLNVFAGTTFKGVFLSKNAGVNWVAVNTGLTTLQITAMAVSGGDLYIGTQPGGIWRRPLPEFGLFGIPTIQGGSIKVKLEQNFPNPFNSFTTIEYSLSNAAFVTLKICNIYGQEVATLVSQKRLPGQYHVSWNAASFPDGVYTCCLSAGGVFQSRKLVLIR
jgi:hypothetical protein